jgi:succinoglycan biosynthesis transport protein ExoP
LPLRRIGGYCAVNVSVGDVYRALWRQRFFVLLFTAALVAGVWFMTSTEHKEYKASSLIRVQQRIQDPTQVLGALETGGRLVQTYARIATTATIAGKIAKTLEGSVPPSEVYGSISAHQEQDLELLTITAKSENPGHAQLIANAAPGALRSFVAETATPDDQIITVQPAGLPTSPSSPRLKFNLMVALLLGVIFGGGIALIMELLLDRVRTIDELEHVAGRPVLATVPILQFVPRRTGFQARDESPAVKPQPRAARSTGRASGA